MGMPNRYPPETVASTPSPFPPPPSRGLGREGRRQAVVAALIGALAGIALGMGALAWLVLR